MALRRFFCAGMTEERARGRDLASRSVAAGPCACRWRSLFGHCLTVTVRSLLSPSAVYLSRTRATCFCAAWTAFLYRAAHASFLPSLPRPCACGLPFLRENGTDGVPPSRGASTCRLSTAFLCWGGTLWRTHYLYRTPPRAAAASCCSAAHSAGACLPLLLPSLPRAVHTASAPYLISPRTHRCRFSAISVSARAGGGIASGGTHGVAFLCSPVGDLFCWRGITGRVEQAGGYDGDGHLGKTCGSALLYLCTCRGSDLADELSTGGVSAGAGLAGGRRRKDGGSAWRFNSAVSMLALLFALHYLGRTLEGSLSPSPFPACCFFALPPATSAQNCRNCIFLPPAAMLAAALASLFHYASSLCSYSNVFCLFPARRGGRGRTALADGLAGFRTPWRLLDGLWAAARAVACVVDATSALALPVTLLLACWYRAHFYASAPPSPTLRAACALRWLYLTSRNLSEHLSRAVPWLASYACWAGRCALRHGATACGMAASCHKTRAGDDAWAPRVAALPFHRLGGSARAGRAVPWRGAAWIPIVRLRRRRSRAQRAAVAREHLYSSSICIPWCLLYLPAPFALLSIPYPPLSLAAL